MSTARSLLFPTNPHAMPPPTPHRSPGSARGKGGPRRRAALVTLVLVALALLVTQAIDGLRTPPAAGAAPAAYFGTLPPGSALPAEADCAARVRRHGWEPRPQNAPKNGAVSVRIPSLTADPANRRPDFRDRVSGNFAGTTDELRQFYACKWGLDEVHLGAVMHYESQWDQGQLGDFRPLAGNPACQPGHRTDPCPESFGVTQVRIVFYPGTAPAAIDSTSFNLDYYGASQRACFEGLTAWLGNGYGPGNLLGCAGWWYNGGSWLDEGTSGTYRRNIQSRIAAPPWHAWPGWPGYAAGAPAAPSAPTATATATAKTPTATAKAPATATKTPTTATAIATKTPPPAQIAPPAGSAPAPGASGGEVVVYDDAVGAGFWDGSYGYAARNACDAATHATPGCSYAVALNPWGALNFGKEGGFATAGYGHLAFALHPHGQALSSLVVRLTAHPSGTALGQVSLSNANMIATLANGWVQVAVPLAQLNPSNATAYTLQIQNGTANPLATIHVDALRLVAGDAQPVQPTKTPRPKTRAANAFPDVAADTVEGIAIDELTARGVIRGYADGRFGPDDTVLRAQMAALIARAAGWDGEDHGNPFTDRNGLDAELWRNVGTLAHRGVAKGYGNGSFGPSRQVTRAETLAFITRALVAGGHWGYPADAPGGVASGPHARDIAAYLAHVGALPEGTSSLDQPATRGWFATALWAAFQTTDIAP